MDALEAVGDPELRDALLYARAQKRPVTADELATARGVHRNVARSRLERLAQAGLLVAAYERRTGREGPGAGRPAKTYEVAPELEAVEFPARRYETLLGLLVDAIGPHDRSARLRDVGVEFGRELARAARLRPARSLRGGFEGMCAAVRSLGYQAAVEEVRADGATIATPTCPLRPLVRARPEAAEIDRGMWAGLAAAALVDAEVSDVACETADCLLDHASCRVVVTLTARQAAPSS
jgi:predicted ArsR family transcriptional regulator